MKPSPRAAVIDTLVHAERVTRQGRKVTYMARYGELPPGTFIASDGHAHLIGRGRLFEWSHHAYARTRAALPHGARVEVLTPRSIVAMFARGFRPQVHASACD